MPNRQDTQAHQDYPLNQVNQFSPANLGPAGPNAAEVGTGDASAIANAAESKDKDVKGGALAIVLQWLCYSLWGWALIALSWLLSATLAYYFVDKNNQYSQLIYLMASLIVLTPIAFIVDKIYRRYEPRHKHGFAAALFVISAVITFLAALGAIIAIVTSAISLILRPESTSGSTVAIISGTVVASLAVLLFLRIINNRKFNAFVKLFPLIITAVTIASLAMAIAGPIGREYNARNDRVIENNVPRLTHQISSYASDNQSLPESLDQLIFPDYDKDAKILIERRLVDYRVVKQPDAQATSGNKSSGTMNSSTRSGTASNASNPQSKLIINPSSLADITSGTSPTENRTGKYELCVTYHAKRGTGKAQDTDRYTTTTPSVLDHPAGRVCYKQSVYVYSPR